MKIKLIAFDLDGTIFTNKVSEKVKLAFSELQKKNIKLLPITGRSLKSTLEILDMANIQNRDLTVLTTGALVQNLNTKQILNENFLTVADFIKLKKYETEKIHIYVYTTEFLYYSLLSDEFLSDASALKDPIKAITNQNFIGNICRINFMGKEEELNKFKEKYLSTFEKDYYAISNIPTSLELLSKNSSKANGLKFIMSYYGLNKDEILAIGDGNNDISMLDIVTNSVAMGNASDIVKSHAKYVTKSVYDDGFYEILKELKILD